MARMAIDAPEASKPRDIATKDDLVFMPSPHLIHKKVKASGKVDAN
jgi:hypothetical protein